MEQIAVQQASTAALWVGFAVGLLARWGDRAQYVISESKERTWRGYVEHNWWRLSVRLIVTCYAFYLALGFGWVVSEVVAFSIGVSADVFTESFIDRARKQGEQLGGKLKGTWSGKKLPEE